MIAGTQAMPTILESEYFDDVQQNNLTKCDTLQDTKNVNVNDTYEIQNHCTSAVTYTFEIDEKDGMYHAFKIQLNGDMSSLKRKDAKLTIDQPSDKAGTAHNYLNCADGNATTCAAIFNTAGITTYTYRKMTIVYTPATPAILVSCLITPISTDNMNEPELNTDKQEVKPTAFEYTRQIFKVMAKTNDKDYKYVSKFNVLPNNETTCFLDGSTATLKLSDGKNNVNLNCNTTAEQTITDTAILEYHRMGVAYAEPTFMGQMMITSTKNSGTRSAFSWAAVLLVAYQIMLKY